MRFYKLVLAVLAVSIFAAGSGTRAAAQNPPNNPPPQVAPPGPCELCARIAGYVSRDLDSLQPINGYWVEAGLARWQEMRNGLSQDQARSYDACFQDLEMAYQHVLGASQTWAMASQDQISIPAEQFLAMKFNLAAEVSSARDLLERAARGCQAQQPPPGSVR